MLIVMMTVTICSVHAGAHAMQNGDSEASDQSSHSDVSVPHQCPCSPLDQHKDYDGCDTCFNCPCHAPLTVQPLQLSYNPIVINLNTSEPFKYLPEVYLTKFIPPQIPA